MMMNKDLVQYIILVFHVLSSDNLSRPQEPITCMTHSDFSIDDWVDMFDLYVFSSHAVQDEDAFETVMSLGHADCRHDGPCGC